MERNIKQDKFLHVQALALASILQRTYYPKLFSPSLSISLEMIFMSF